MVNRLYNKQVSPKGYMKGGRIKKMGGGSLKPVDPKTQKGLSKLPTKVRNKMGYMKDGGSVKTSKQEIFDIVDRRVKDKEASQKIKERLTNPDYFKKKKFGGGKK